MSCNSCSKSFSLLRQEKGCPGCGFSYCSKCLNNKIFLEKINSEAKVCNKCKNKKNSNESNKIVPPDAYYKRISALDEATSSSEPKNHIEQEIQDRLRKLKDHIDVQKPSSNAEIIERLQKLKGNIPVTSDSELQARLANIKGVPLSAVQSKPALPVQDTRTEQEQADDLLKRYMDETKMDKNYKDEFDHLVSDIESRLQNLKGPASKENVPQQSSKSIDDSEDEEETVKKILEKVKAETALEGNEISEPVLDELPFCEICNEDATMRCLGCKYLFCKRCYLEHRDDEDCNKYETYTAPKNSTY
ncbi:abscission/NoCut checkpoint regulator [Danaus plexippus]|uniref:abscission/NoCut checkpoint regulator n=1 Tax=Danaus plexippus TaxID=13037 RepID=UPI002AB078FB|nr:abscission/NoCut checkpoint regulator [Danaus plexippus]